MFLSCERQPIDKLKNKLYLALGTAGPAHQQNAQTGKKKSASHECDDVEGKKRNNCVFVCTRARTLSDLVTTNNKCVLHSLRYMCFSESLAFHFISFCLALHAIKCVDYKVVAIDLILMLVCGLSLSLSLWLAHLHWVECVRFNVYYFANRTFYKVPVSNEKC